MYLISYLKSKSLAGTLVTGALFSMISQQNIFAQIPDPHTHCTTEYYEYVGYRIDKTVLVHCTVCSSNGTPEEIRDANGNLIALKYTFSPQTVQKNKVTCKYTGGEGKCIAADVIDDGGACDPVTVPVQPSSGTGTGTGEGTGTGTGTGS